MQLHTFVFLLRIQFGLSAIHDDAAAAGEFTRSVRHPTGIDTKFHATAGRAPATNAIQPRR